MVVLSSPLQYLQSIPTTTRWFSAATVAASIGYIVLLSPAPAPALLLVPGNSIFYPWSFLTSSLIEPSIIGLIFTMLCVPPFLGYLEKVWGSIETLKFIVVTLLLPNVMTFAVCWIEYLVLGIPSIIYTAYYGQMALQAALLVAFTQLMPEHRVRVGPLETRIKNLPMAYVTISTVMTIIGFQSPWINIQWGWLVSWTYLRFYKKNRSDSIVSESYGDRSETFAFVQWFPPFIHTPINMLGNFVHPLASRFHIIPGAGTDVESGGYSQVPGGSRAEAERRRALALKALDHRMASSNIAGAREGSSQPASGSVPPSAGSTAETSRAKPLASERKKSVSEVDIGIPQNKDDNKSGESV